jgi:Bacterial Ig domain
MKLKEGQRAKRARWFGNVFRNMGFLQTGLFSWFAAAVFTVNVQSAAPQTEAEDPQLAQLPARVGELMRQVSAPTIPPQTVPGADSLLFVYLDVANLQFNLGRREAAQGDDEDGVRLATRVNIQRPAVTGDGSIALFLTEDSDLCAVNTADRNSRRCLGIAGRVRSVAVSPDATLFAFVFYNATNGLPEDKITLVNLAANKSTVYQLVSPIADGVAVDTVLSAGAMTFSTDGTMLVYGALSRLKFGNGPTVQRWSIYSLHLDSGQTTILVPPRDGIDAANPAFGRAGNRYIAYDAVPVATGVSSVMVLDLFTGESSEVGTAPGGFSSPCFLGDESGLIYTSFDDDALIGSSLFKQDLASDRLHSQGNPTIWCQDAAWGVVYRRGALASSNALPMVTLQISADQIPAQGNVTLTATASDSDGTIARVEFYDNKTKLGLVEKAPYVFQWQSVPAGNHLLTARAVDNAGATTESSPRFLTVSGSPDPGGDKPKISIQSTAKETVRLTVKAPAGYYIIAMSEDLETWTDIYPLTIDNSGIGSIDDSGGPTHYSSLFYRVRRDP